MARIQWTPIVAPDVAESALRAQAMAGSSLQSALGGFTNLLTQYEGDRREANLLELARRQNAFTPTAEGVAGYTADLADGDLIRGLNFLKASDLAAARSYTGELRAGRNAEFQFGRQVTDANRVDEAYTEARHDRQTGIETARLANAIRTGLADPNITPERRAELMAQRDALSARLQNAGQINDLFSAERSGIEDYRSGRRYGQEEIGWERSNEAYNNERDAEALALRFQEYGANATVDDLIGDAQYKAANPRVRARALQLAGLPQAAADVTGGGGGSFVGPADMQEHHTAVADVLSGGGLAPHVVAGFLGNFEVEGGYGGALGDGGTASGIAQWRNERRTAFRRQYGKDPHQATAAEQAQFVLWELNTPEGRRVAGITEAQANLIKNAPNAEIAAQRIDQFYERSSGEHRDRRVAAARRFMTPREVQGVATDVETGATVARASDRYGPNARNIVNALNDDTPTIQVVEALTSERGALAGADSRRVGQLIREIQGRYSRQSNGGRLSAAAAAQILVGTVKPADLGKDFFRNITGRSSAIYDEGSMFSGARNTISWTDVDGLLNRLIPVNGRIPLASDARNEENRQAMISGASNGRAQLEAARQALVAQERQDAARGIRNNPVTARMRQNFEALNAQFMSFAGDAEAQLQAGGLGAPRTRRTPQEELMFLGQY